METVETMKLPLRTTVNRDKILYLAAHAQMVEAPVVGMGIPTTWTEHKDTGEDPEVATLSTTGKLLEH